MKTNTTLGALKASGYTYKSIKDELRTNLIQILKNGDRSFRDIYGYDDTVIPDLERAILSKHNILLLGLRGQAKTRLARLMVDLLDEYIPVIADSELNEDPCKPFLKSTLNLMQEAGDDLPIKWIHRSERYVEKLATPDVSIADLIGDIDPIKAANNKWSYADERSIHYGLVPRSNRCIFAINELPDLQPRIQVSLLNILQEGDIQTRGYKMRLPLDIQFVFTANPEDYTHRGSIITPLKDRIDSQILTHYPDQLDIAMSITLQEARIENEVRENIYLSPTIHRILERISFIARDSEYVDENSGVSARLSISALENLYSAAERRMLIANENKGIIRLIDLIGIIPAITGKVELVYEGEQEGPYNVALHLMGFALRDEFLKIFPDPEQYNEKRNQDPYFEIKSWFSKGNTIEILNIDSDDTVFDKLSRINGLSDLVLDHSNSKAEVIIMMELVLHGLAELNIISREMLDHKVSFNDSLADMFDDILNGSDDNDDY